MPRSHLSAHRRLATGASALALLLLVTGCGDAGPGEGTTAKASDNTAAERSGAGRGHGFGPPGGAASTAAVPVEVTPVVRREISRLLETHCTLEAENEVDIVARTTGPVVELAAEEGMRVSRGDLLLRLDDDEIRAQLEASRVAFEEAEQAYERARRLREEELLSREQYEQALATYESTRAQYQGNQVQLGYTRITAPFDGLIVERYVKFAQHVTPGTALFRISDFDPLLCPIQVPERELPRLAEGQRARLEVEPYPGQTFEARVIRVRPVVNPETGTVEVTLEAHPDGKLTPGMFADVFLVTETRAEALVIPKAALALESLGDTVYVADEGVASRRSVELGFRESDAVEVTAGLAAGEQVVVVGQDGLSNGTPVRILEPTGGVPPEPEAHGGNEAEAPDGRPGFSPPGGPGGFDPSNLTDTQRERIRERMRQRGLSEEEIDQRLERLGGGEGTGKRP